MVVSDEIISAIILSGATIVAALIGFAAVYITRRPPPARATNDTEALVDKIVSMAKAGKLPIPLTAGALVEAFPERRQSYLRSLLANYCHPEGNYVRQGQRARFRRVAKGQYVPL